MSIGVGHTWGDSIEFTIQMVCSTSLVAEVGELRIFSSISFAKSLCFYLEGWGKIPQQRPGAGIPSYDSIRKDFWEPVYIRIFYSF
jgi:hypothetical protein